LEQRDNGTAKWCEKELDASVCFPYLLRMNLKHLSDSKLHSEIIELARRERALLAQILWHLREVDRRKLYADHRCSSLFDYCVRKLKYSEGQAARRVSACRLLKDLPELEQDIQRGEINLTQLNQLKHFFQDEAITSRQEKLEVLEQVKGKTTRESEAILWQLKKEEAPRKVSLQINEETFKELEKLKGLRAHSIQDFDQLFLEMVKLARAAWTPEAKRVSAGANINARYLSVQTRAQVWQRDRGRCRNCGGGYALQYDHIRPFSRGGKTVVENMQLLCRNCNQRKGARVIRAPGISQDSR
jgi:hypothetical protein